MVSLWITIGLILAATMVSSLGAYFSIVGLGALFSGAMLAVWLMAGSLEFAKFVLAAYLHQTWKDLNKAFKIYTTFAVITLSLITSIGIFGFLSDAYQSASTTLDSENIRLENIKKQNELVSAELERINYTIEEIPEDRINRRLKARATAEPKILELNKKLADGEKALSEASLKIVEVKKKVGPLIYISRSLKIDIDLVVKYLILIFVSVFDPLAICLVIASSHATSSRKNGVVVTENKKSNGEAASPPVKVVAVTDSPSVIETASETPIQIAPEVEAQDDDIVVQMNFKDPEESAVNKNKAG